MSEMFSGEGNPFYGRHHTKKSKVKISENRKGKGGKKVQCIETGEKFECMMDAARKYKLKTAASIGQCCMGKAKSAGKDPITKKSLHWKFIEKE